MPTTTSPISARVFAEVKIFWMYLPQFRPRVFAAVRNAISRMAKNCCQERLTAYFSEIPIGATIQARGETAGTSTPRNRAKATATAAIVPVWITRKSVQPYRKPQSGE